MFVHCKIIIIFIRHMTGQQGTECTFYTLTTIRQVNLAKLGG